MALEERNIDKMRRIGEYLCRPDVIAGGIGRGAGGTRSGADIIRQAALGRAAVDRRKKPNARGVDPIDESRRDLLGPYF